MRCESLFDWSWVSSPHIHSVEWKIPIGKEEKRQHDRPDIHIFRFNIFQQASTLRDMNDIWYLARHDKQAIFKDEIEYLRTCSACDETHKCLWWKSCCCCSQSLYFMSACDAQLLLLLLCATSSHSTYFSRLLPPSLHIVCWTPSIDFDDNFWVTQYGRVKSSAKTCGRLLISLEKFMANS